jgi:hypothetical protein
MSDRVTYQITVDDEGGRWAIRDTSGDRLLDVFGTREEAIARARELVREKMEGSPADQEYDLIINTPEEKIVIEFKHLHEDPGSSSISPPAEPGGESEGEDEGDEVDFERDLDYVLTKNAELYRRLAR